MTTNQPSSRSSRTRRSLFGLFKWLAIYTVLIFLTLTLGLSCFQRQANNREIQTYQEAAPPDGRLVSTGDLEIYIQEMGSTTGSTVLFVHGTGAWSEIWHQPMTVLADAGFHSIALDLPPFGFSERPPGNLYSRPAQAERIVGVMQALDLSQVILVGHSFGAGPAVEAALLAPERVQALVLVDAALGLEESSRQPDVLPSIVKNVINFRALRNALVATVITNPMFTKQQLQALIHNPTNATDAHVAMIQQQLVVEDSTNDLGDYLRDFLTRPQTGLSTEATNYRNMTMPVLLIWGDSDMITPLSQGEQLHQIIPNSELIVLPQVGHIPHIENVEQFNDALLGFLQER